MFSACTKTIIEPTKTIIDTVKITKVDTVYIFPNDTVKVPILIDVTKIVGSWNK